MQQRKYKLLGNRIIGVPELIDLRHTPIVIPDAFQSGIKSSLEKTLIPVRVFAIGDKFKYKEVKVGDIVYFSKYFGDELTPIRELVNEPEAKLYSGDDAMAYECSS